MRRSEAAMSSSDDEGYGSKADALPRGLNKMVTKLAASLEEMREAGEGVGGKDSGGEGVEASEGEGGSTGEGEGESSSEGDAEYIAGG